MSVYVIEVYKIYEKILLFFNCVMSVAVLYLLLAMPWVGLRSDIWVFPGHIRVLFEAIKCIETLYIKLQWYHRYLILPSF